MILRPRHARIPVRAALATLALLALAGGCVQRSEVLARVGDQTITRADFEAAAASSAGQYAGPPERARVLLLDDLVKRALLLEEAKRLHVVPDTALASERRRIEDPIVLQALVEQLAPQAIQVSDGEVAALWRQRAIEAHAQLVFVTDEAAGQRALDMIHGGIDFGTVADRLNLANVLPPRGDLGFVTPGALLDPLDALLVTAPLGKVVGPVEAQGEGWFLLRVLARRPRVQPPLAQEAPTLREMIRQRKQRTVRTRALLALRDAYQVHVPPQAVAAMFRRYNAAPESMMVQPPGIHVARPPTPAEAATVLATYDDGTGHTATYMLGEAVRELQDPNTQKPNFMMAPLIEQWITSRVMQRVAVIEGHRRHLAEDPDVARRVRERLNNVLLEAVYAREVVGRAGAPDSADLRAAYTRHAAQLVRLEQADVATMMTPDSALAASVAMHAMHETLPAAARSATPPAPVRQQTVRFPSTDPLWQNLEGMLGAMQPGEIRGPLRLPTGWILVQLIAKRQGVQAYGSLQPQVMQALQSEALEFRREERLQALTDSLRMALRPEIHPERLQSIPWPESPPGSPPQS